LIASAAYSAIVLGLLSSGFLFILGNFHNLYIWSKLVFLGHPIIHPMLIHDALENEKFQKFDAIFERAVRADVAIFGIRDRIFDKTGFDRIEQKRFYLEDKNWFKVVSGLGAGSGDAGRVWKVQPLHSLLMDPSLNKFCFLMIIGADWTVQNENGSTCFDELLKVLEKDSGQKLRQLHPVLKSWFVSKDRWIKMFRAASERGYTNCLQNLINNRRSKLDFHNNDDDDQNCAIHYVVDNKLVDVVRKLIDG